METAPFLASEIFINNSLKLALPENDLKEARGILGTLADQLTSDQLKVAMVEIEYLAESWLDDFERGIFGGNTLNELLNTGGAL